MKVAKELEAKVACFRELAQPSMIETLNITFDVIEEGRIVASMPVNEKTKQPLGSLHGGASVALAETAASVGAWLHIDHTRSAVVGSEINANHVKPVRSGTVTATATPLHLGRRTHVWDIRITNEEKELVCISRCTLMVSTLD